MVKATVAQEFEIAKHVLAMIEDRGYSVEEAAEAVQPWFPEFTIVEIAAIYRN